jgi:hypothetical protein
MTLPTIRTIDAGMLQLALVARRLNTTRALWCAMSDHVHTQPCRFSAGTYRLPQKSAAGPLSRGDWYRVLWRVEAQGAKACRKTFGIGIRALRAENHYLIER